MITIVTDKFNKILSFIVVGGDPELDDGKKMYKIDPECIPKEVIEDITSFEYNGFVFTKLNKQVIQQQNIDSYKSAKISSMSSMCSLLITEGIDYNGEHYSLTDIDQLNLSRLGMQAGLDNAPALVYHPDGKPCRVYSSEEMLGLVNKASAWISYNTTYYNLLKQYIENNIVEVSSVIAIKYFDQLPPYYQDQLNDMVDISSYDFDITPIQDYTSYDNVVPKISAEDCLKDYFEQRDMSTIN